ncbi:hypothetical protein BpHYR1_025160 [Brachionus plicatilis]|uniref:Uncharacterized protein n=1 Tax=Brachionus plicatilis TaxID=10195 RepID=A0A3M7T1T1_BRAPC|nr:hypothetical protein BpHYR1_025160 [Brachionus plicatilis]
MLKSKKLIRIISLKLHTNCIHSYLRLYLKLCFVDLNVSFQWNGRLISDSENRQTVVPENIKINGEDIFIKIRKKKMSNQLFKRLMKPLINLKINLTKHKLEKYLKIVSEVPTASEETLFGVKRALSKHTNPLACPECGRLMKNERGVKNLIMKLTNDFTNSKMLFFSENSDKKVPNLGISNKTKILKNSVLFQANKIIPLCQIKADIMILKIKINKNTLETNVWWQIEVHDQIHNFEYLNILEESIKDLNQLNFDHLIMIMNLKLPCVLPIYQNLPDNKSSRIPRIIVKKKLHLLTFLHYCNKWYKLRLFSNCRFNQHLAFCGLEELIAIMNLIMLLIKLSNIVLLNSENIWEISRQAGMEFILYSKCFIK